MPDLGLFSMVLGIIVLVIWFVLSTTLRSASDIVLLFRTVTHRARLKKAGYYDIPASPGDFFERHRSKYLSELLRRDYRRIPNGVLKQTIKNLAIRSASDRIEVTQFVASCLASEKEIKCGYRPTIAPVGYLVDTNDIWDSVRQAFLPDYKKSVERFSDPEKYMKMLSYQIKDDETYTLIHGELKEDDD